MHSRLALTLAAVFLAPLAGCGRTTMAWRPVPTRAVWTTNDPKLLLTELAENGYDPGGSCWTRYAVEVAVGRRVIHLTQAMGPTIAPPDGATCAANAVGGIYLKIDLPAPYTGQRIVDDATGERVVVVGRLRLADLPHPPVISGQ